MRSLLLLLLALALLPAANAQIVTYSFAGLLGDEASAPPDAQPEQASASDITRGRGLEPNAGGNAFAAKSFTPDREPDPDDYFEVTLEPAPGFALALTDLVFDERRSLTGPRRWEVRSSLDGFERPLASGMLPDDTETRFDQRVQLGADFAALTERVSFRIYGYEAEETGGSWRLHGVRVLGAVPTRPQAVAREPGWRLLSAPVEGMRVEDLAAMNLVQGIDTQYPGAGANLFLAYGGEGSRSYVAAQSGEEPVEPGRGFFWYWYGEAFGPFEGGTSYSRDLGEFTLAASGRATVDHILKSFPGSRDGFYMLGNPFPYEFDVACISPDAGPVQGSVVQLYDPVGRSYVPRFGDFRETVAPWQGFFAEIGADPEQALLVRYKPYLDECVFPEGRAGVVGKQEAAPRVAFTLTGATADGETVRDEAAIVRFRDGATDGWDVHDASKLTPPAATHAMLAPVTTRDGEAYRTAISSLPAALDAPAVVPVSFLATDAGSYEIAWAAPLPAGWTAELRDLVTGAVTDLASSATYAFTSEATGWTPRFELVVTASGVVATESGEIAEASLSAPQPNPASGSTTFALSLDAAEHVTATLYDALGRAVATVFSGGLPAGSTTEFAVNAADLAPGVYVLRVLGDTFAQSRSLTVVR